MQSSTAVTVFRALSDERRLSIVKKLAATRATVASCDLVESCASFLALSQPTMSHHFHKLVEAGVLIEEKQGTHKLYRLNDELLRSVGLDVSKL